MDVRIRPHTLAGAVTPPPSKSMAHRLLLAAALADGVSTVKNVALSQDIEATLRCMAALGASWERTDKSTLRVTGIGGKEKSFPELPRFDCGESGSTLRFFIPLALDGRGAVRFEGRGRLMQRPLSVYEDMFKARGILWRHEGDSLTVDGLLESGRYSMPGDVSSQFITGMLLALPRLEGDSVLEIKTPLESRAYVELTRRIQAHYEKGQSLLIPGGQRAVSPGRMHIGGDWSHAAFYLVASAIGRGEIRLTGLDPNSAQGDRALVGILRDMGADIRWEGDELVARASKLHGLHADCSQIPDVVPALAVAMAAAEGESRISGAARLRIKESDRLSAMCAALSAAGACIRETEDGLLIHGGKQLCAARIDGCNDHRIVMAMAVLCAALGGTIRGAETVNKSYPDFFRTLRALGLRMDVRP